MRKMALFLALILILSVPTTVYAAVPEEISPFALKIMPSLSFEENTAHCTATVIGDNMNDSISITMKLWRGNVCYATWSTSGNGYLQFTRSKPVTAGLEYRLTVDVTINGLTKPTVSVNGTC
jgi:hypothetical protein